MGDKDASSGARRKQIVNDSKREPLVSTGAYGSRLNKFFKFKKDAHISG